MSTEKNGLIARHVILLASFAALTPVAIDMYLPAIPAMAGELGVTVGQASLSVSVFFFGVAFGQLVAGPISDRYGRRPTIITGLILFMISAVLASFATDFALLIAARIAQAFGACAVTVAGRAIVKDKLDLREASRTFSLLALVGGVAPIMAPLIGAGILNFGDWRMIFFVMASLAVLVLIGHLAFMPETRDAESRALARTENPLRTYWLLLRNPRVLGFILAAAGNSACLFTYITNSPVVFMSGYGFTPMAFSMAFGANAVGLLIANQFNRHILKTANPMQVLRRSAISAALLACLFAAFAATQFGGLYTISALLFVGVASTAVVQANVMAGALSVDPMRAGSISALYGASTFAFGTLAASLAALLETGSGQAMAMIIALGFALCSAAILLLVSKKTNQNTGEETP